ncbi:g11246 [Coccomyxa viridis]|uniref:G11246 protein n=1 Tax=Coccomyxa viridis TaxID=1274662 RepID=A0ABP1GA64_9CHLO
MERPAPCPRVNFALMERYIGQHVLLVCKLDSLEPQMNRAHVVTSDGGRVTVALKTATFDSSFVEFEGIVDAPNQLREEARCEFGSSFDMTTYDRLCQLSNTDYKTLFA